jgi:sulfide dehydrogenase cytochrome subunit
MRAGLRLEWPVGMRQAPQVSMGVHVTGRSGYTLLFMLLWLMSTSMATAEDFRGRNWAGACTGCHATEGRSEGAIPPLAGIDKARFVRLMRAYRAGEQPATIMHQHAKGLNDEEIDVLGDYFSSRTAQ